MSRERPQPADLEPPVADEGLRCLECGYNLTGLLDGECPECGAAFEVGKLRQILAGEPGPFPIWDDRGRIGVARAFFKTIRAAWFAPTGLLNRMPPNHGESSARRFSALCYTVAAVLASIGLVVSAPSLLGAYFPLATAGIVTLVMLQVTFPYMTAGAIAGRMSKVSSGRLRGVMHGMSSHAIPVGAACGLGIAGIQGAFGSLSRFFVGVAGIVLVGWLLFWLIELVWVAYLLDRRRSAVPLNVVMVVLSLSVSWMVGAVAGQLLAVVLSVP
jgi:hypothetical protein